MEVTKLSISAQPSQPQWENKKSKANQNNTTKPTNQAIKTKDIWYAKQVTRVIHINLQWAAVLWKLMKILTGSATIVSYSTSSLYFPAAEK